MSEDALKSWNVFNLKDNMSSVRCDGDRLSVVCPECDLWGYIKFGTIVEHGSVECENCGTEFGLLLVEKPKS